MNIISFFLMRYVCPALTIIAVASVTASASITRLDEPLRIAIDEYGDFLDSLDRSHDFSEQEVADWVARIESAIPTSTDPRHVDTGWMVIITLHNTQSDWVRSSAACEAAIDIASSEEVRFQRLYDLYTVQCNMTADMPSRERGTHDPVFQTAERIIGTFDALWGPDGSEEAARVWNMYSSVLDALTRHPGSDPARVVELCQNLVTRAGSPWVRSRVNPKIVQMFRGRATGVLLRTDAARACDLLIADGSPFPPDETAVAAALKEARENGATWIDRNILLWCATEFLGGVDRLKLGVGHVSGALNAESERGMVDLLPGSRQSIQGIPIEDLISLIEPPIADMISAGGAEQLRSSVPKDEHAKRELLKTGVAVLADLLRIAGDAEAADYYANLFPR